MLNDPSNVPDIVLPPAWTARAACVDQTELFDRLADQASGTRLQQARELCSTCPVQAECLQMAMDMESGVRGGRDFRYGVYAGTTPSQRHLIAGRTSRAPLTEEQRRRKTEGERARRKRIRVMKGTAA